MVRLLTLRLWLPQIRRSFLIISLVPKSLERTLCFKTNARSLSFFSLLLLCRINLSRSPHLTVHPCAPGAMAPSDSLGAQLSKMVRDKLREELPYMKQATVDEVARMCKGLIDKHVEAA